MFSRVGFPKEIYPIREQISCFHSYQNRAKCSFRKLSTTPLSSTSKRDQQNDLGALKQILKAYAVVDPLESNFHLRYVLFAYRKVPNETTGFIPFELLYARQVRGHLDNLKGSGKNHPMNRSSLYLRRVQNKDSFF